MTDDSFPASAPGDSPDSAATSAAGVWTLSGDRPIIAEREGPATILVPSESVLLLAVDLPFASRSRRIEALPFAIEDRIAESIESVHIALGAEIAPRRYLAAVVRHDLMARWVEAAEAAGLGAAALVPDALALPIPPDGHWSVDLGDTRAVVRAGDGTGFAVAAPMLLAAWDAAGQPPATAYGAPLPEIMAEGAGTMTPASLAERLASPALDLRQGAYARRYRGASSLGRRLAWIIGLGALAHAGIAAADTLALRAIADRREADARALAVMMAPGATLGEDVTASVADMLPAPGRRGDAAFLQALDRVSAALAPVSPAVRAMRYEGGVLVLDLQPGEPGLAQRVRAALQGAGVAAQVTDTPDGGVRVTAGAV